MYNNFKMKTFIITLLILVAGALLIVNEAMSQESSQQLPDKVEFERAIFAEVNRVRFEHGVPATEWHDVLYIHAIEACDRCSSLQQLDHGDNHSPWGENLYGGILSYFEYKESSVTPEGIVDNWWNSPLHKGAMLNPNIIHSAVAVSFENGFWVSWSYPLYGEPVGYSPWPEYQRKDYR